MYPFLFDSPENSHLKTSPRTHLTIQLKPRALTANWLLAGRKEGRKERSGAEQRSGCGAAIHAASPGCARIPSQGLYPPRARSRPGRRGAGSGSPGDPRAAAGLVQCHSLRFKQGRGKKGGGGKKRGGGKGSSKIGALCLCLCVCARIPTYSFPLRQSAGAVHPSVTARISNYC